MAVTIVTTCDREGCTSRDVTDDADGETPEGWFGLVVFASPEPVDDLNCRRRMRRARLELSVCSLACLGLLGSDLAVRFARDARTGD